MAIRDRRDLIEFLKERQRLGDAGLLMVVVASSIEQVAEPSRGYSLRLRHGAVTSASCGADSGAAVIDRFARCATYERIRRAIKSAAGRPRDS